jgi:hypothetical protein
VRPEDGAFAGLRLAAKAADRQNAAGEQWPAFQAHLRDLGYSPKAIAQAFSTLSGPGTVAEALAVLKSTGRSLHPVILDFEIHDPPGNYSTGKGVSITSVERAEDGIRVGYEVEIVPPSGVAVALDAHGPRAEGKDDLGNVYRPLGSYFGLAAGDDSRGTMTRAHGGFTLPAPDSAASELRIRMTWNATLPSLWRTPGREAIVSLPS